MKAAITTLAILAILGGYLVTWLPFDGPRWGIWVALRVVLQIGGAAVLGWLVAVSLRRGMARKTLPLVRGALVGGAAGLVLCWAPVLDLLEGPLQLEQAQPAVYVERWTMSGRPHQRQELCFRDVEHRLACIAPLAPKVLWVGPLVAQCEEQQTLDIAILRHLEVVVDARCRPPALPPPPDDFDDDPPGAGRSGYAMLEELRSQPTPVAERRSRIALLAAPRTLYSVIFGAERTDGWAVGLIQDAIAQREDLSRGHLQQTLRETYGQTE